MKRPLFRRGNIFSRDYVEPILDVDWSRWIFGVRWTGNVVVFFGPLAYLHRGKPKRYEERV